MKVTPDAGLLLVSTILHQGRILAQCPSDAGNLCDQIDPNKEMEVEYVFHRAMKKIKCNDTLEAEEVIKFGSRGPDLMWTNCYFNTLYLGVILTPDHPFPCTPTVQPGVSRLLYLALLTCKFSPAFFPNYFLEPQVVPVMFDNSPPPEGLFRYQVYVFKLDDDRVPLAQAMYALEDNRTGFRLDEFTVRFLSGKKPEAVHQFAVTSPLNSPDQMPLVAQPGTGARTAEIDHLIFLALLTCLLDYLKD